MQNNLLGKFATIELKAKINPRKEDEAWQGPIVAVYNHEENVYIVVDDFDIGPIAFAIPNVGNCDSNNYTFKISTSL